MDEFKFQITGSCGMRYKIYPVNFSFNLCMHEIQFIYFWLSSNNCNMFYMNHDSNYFYPLSKRIKKNYVTFKHIL